MKVLVCLLVVVILILSPATGRAALGVTWHQATHEASFPKRYGHSSLIFDGKMWVIGGGPDEAAVLNDSWVSDNGTTWSAVYTPGELRFSPRTFHASAVYHGRIWVIGGSDGTSAKNDVWSSADGFSWRLETAAAQFPVRHSHTCQVFDNKLWIMGGYNGQPLYDTWYSMDGTSWTKTTANYAFGRSHASTIFNNKMVVVGGNYNGLTNHVLYSDNGTTWTLYQTPSHATFAAREKHTLAVLDNKIWLIAGANNRADIHFSLNGLDWALATEEAAFPGRQQHTSLVFNNKIWVIGGFHTETGAKNDVWYSTATGGGFPPTPAHGELIITFRQPRASLDFESQQVLYTYEWTSTGGDHVLHGPTSSLSDSLTETHLVQSGETWTVVVTPTDGIMEGESASASFKVIKNENGVLEWTKY